MVVTVLKVLDKKLKSRRFSTEVMENFIILFHYTLFYAELHKVFMKTDDCSQKDRQVIHRLKKTERLYEKD